MLQHNVHYSYGIIFIGLMDISIVNSHTHLLWFAIWHCTFITHMHHWIFHWGFMWMSLTCPKLQQRHLNVWSSVGLFYSLSENASVSKSVGWSQIRNVNPQAHQNWNVAFHHVTHRKLTLKWKCGCAKWQILLLNPHKSSLHSIGVWTTWMFNAESEVFR